jgi:hypothetical protein
MENYRTVGYVRTVTVYVLMFSVPSPALAGSAINLPNGAGSVFVQFRQSREAHLVKSYVLHRYRIKKKKNGTRYLYYLTTHFFKNGTGPQKWP